MSALRQRILAAVVLVPVVVAAVLWLPTAGFAAVLGAFAVVAALEWRGVGALTPSRAAAFVALTVASLLCGLFLLVHPGVLRAVLAVAVLWWILALGLVLAFQRGRSPGLLASPAPRFLAGWLLIVPCYLSLVWLHGQGPRMVMYVLVLIWVADSAAFFAGRRFGRHKLASRVSPGKTWEGVAGGLGGVAVLAVAVAVAVEDLPLAPGVLVALSLVVAASSVLGDLVESLFKRLAGVKDSGTLIPGHGGVLDRIDSLTAAGPWFAAGWLVLGAAQ
jgi:phosphatidate cytidylyltransferase